MPDLVEFVALVHVELELRMVVHHLVEHAAVELVGVEPGQIAATHELQPPEHREAPLVGEPRGVEFDALRLGDRGDLIADRVMPVEDRAADVPGERLDVAEVGGLVGHDHFQCERRLVRIRLVAGCSGRCSGCSGSFFFRLRRAG